MLDACMSFLRHSSSHFPEGNLVSSMFFFHGLHTRLGNVHSSTLFTRASMFRPTRTEDVLGLRPTLSISCSKVRRGRTTYYALQFELIILALHATSTPVEISGALSVDGEKDSSFYQGGSRVSSEDFAGRVACDPGSDPRTF